MHGGILVASSPRRLTRRGSHRMVTSGARRFRRSTRRAPVTSCWSKFGCSRCERNPCSSRADITMSPSHDLTQAWPVARTRHGFADRAVSATLATMIGAPSTNASSMVNWIGGSHVRALSAKPCFSFFTSPRSTGRKSFRLSRPRTTHPPPGRLDNPHMLSFSDGDNPPADDLTSMSSCHHQRCAVAPVVRRGPRC